MNKNIKRILSMALAIGTISAAAPANNLNILATKVYAAVENDEDYLDSLELYDEDGSRLKLYSTNEYEKIVDYDEVEEGKTYYVKSSTNTVNIDIEGPSDKYVKIFSGTSSSAKGEDPGDDIDLSDSTITSLSVKVYGEEPDGGIRYSDNDDYTILSTYRVKVEYTGEDEDEDKDDIYLERLSINNNKIELLESQEEYTYNVDSDVNDVIIRATPEDDDYDVTIDDKRVHSADNYKETVHLDKGKNEFPIRIEDGDYEKTYTVIINRGPVSTSNTSTTNEMNAEDYDNIYLDKLSIDGRIIPLLKSKIDYTYNVESDVTKVLIKATPEDEKEEDIIIDGEYVGSNDDYKKTVTLDKGENKIQIEIEDDGDKRVYTVVVNRGSVASTSTSSQNTETAVNTPKINQWIQTNGVWQYKNETGEIVKNTWIGNYYLKENGDMATGWLNYNGSWIYLGTDGAKKTGWQSIEGNWYYLDSQGKILTGWFKDVDGKYYYLNSFGAMAYNTTVDGYKLGSNGVWTGK